MKKFLLAFFILFSTVKIYGQQFSQYNTGTLYDSFENPAQNSFIPDTSRKYAFNLFVPNFSANVYLNGNAQVALKDRLFNSKYLTDNLVIGPGRLNRINSNFNAYFILYKGLVNIDGNSEMGFSIQSKAEVRGVFSDESLALFNGFTNFPENSYDNLFNNVVNVQSYHQISLIYRENLSKTAAIGIKLSALLGVQYQKLDINQSHITFDKAADEATLSLQGQYKINHIAGGISKQDILPSFRNPGASISIGTKFNLDKGYIIQANLKDLGFIKWNSSSNVYNFNSSDVIKDISTRKREDNIFGSTYRIIHSGGKTTSFTSPTNAKFEVSANKTFWFDYENQIKYSPTIVASKDLLYDSYTAALVNPIQYHDYVFTLTAAYNNYKIMSIGTQLMIKATDVEFFVGSDRIFQSISLATFNRDDPKYINSRPSYTGADFFLGFSIKFGPVLEHPLNSSSMPTSQRKSFFQRFIQRLKKSED